MTNQNAQKAAEKWFLCPKEVVRPEIKKLAAIIQTHAIEPAMKERDEVIERLKTRLSKTNNSFRGQMTNDGTDWLQHYIDNEEAILAAKQLRKGKQ